MGYDSTRDTKKVVILAEDRKAAREYVRIHGSNESKEDDALRDGEEKLAALDIASHGIDWFHLVYGLRPPRCIYDQLVVDYFHGRVRKEEVKAVWKSADEQPIDSTIPRAVYEYLARSLNHYREFVDWIVEQQPINEHRSCAAKSPDYSLREMLRTSCLSQRKVDQFRQFVEDARVAKSLRGVSHANADAATAVDLVLLLRSRAVSQWTTCQEIAEGSQTDPRYLYSTTAEELFIDYLKNLSLSKVEAMLREEEAVCRWYLVQQSQQPVSPTIQNTFHIDGTGHSVSQHTHLGLAENSESAPASDVDAQGSKEPDLRPTRTPSQEARPKLANWAMGLDGSHRWWLFHQRTGRWEQSTEIKVPKGNAHLLLEFLAEQGGAFERTSVHARLKGAYPGKRPDELTRICTYALQKAKPAIRLAIATCGHFDYDEVPNPIPWDGRTWRAAIGIGYAVKDDVDRFVFKTHDDLTQDDKLDRS